MTDNVKAKSNSDDVRIYINGILHLRFPRDANNKIHSWIDGGNKMFKIKIWCKNHSEYVSYDNKDIWQKVLKLLDQHL